MRQTFEEQMNQWANDDPPVAAAFPKTDKDGIAKPELTNPYV